MVVDVLVGITPACAGKSSGQIEYSDHYRDHPRVCGEKLLFFEITRALRGSPPRVRGKALENPQDMARRRITPACAGKSPFLVSSKCCY